MLKIRSWEKESGTSIIVWLGVCPALRRSAAFWVENRYTSLPLKRQAFVCNIPSWSLWCLPSMYQNPQEVGSHARKEWTFSETQSKMQRERKLPSCVQELPCVEAASRWMDRVIQAKGRSSCLRR